MAIRHKILQLAIKTEQDPASQQHVSLSTAAVDRRHPTSSCARRRNMSLSLSLTLLSALGFSLTQGEVSIHFHLGEAEEQGTDYSADDKGGALF